jgi:hypothetical protein
MRSRHLTRWVPSGYHFLRPRAKRRKRIFSGPDWPLTLSVARRGAALAQVPNCMLRMVSSLGPSKTSHRLTSSLSTLTVRWLSGAGMD